MGYENGVFFDSDFSFLLKSVYFWVGWEKIDSF